MKTKLITTLILAICFLSNGLFSQNNINNFFYQIVYTTTGAVNYQGDSIFVRECGITIPDTTYINKIHVKIGSEENLSDILNYTFIFDVTNGLPIGLAYLRDGNRVKLQLFETEISDRYFYEVILEDILGNLSVPKKWY
jgi:hypothetical protein